MSTTVPRVSSAREYVLRQGERPLNLGLNDGTWAPQAVVDALELFRDRLAFRNYTTADNDEVRAVIAEIDGVTPKHVFLANGSGPILKQCVPWIVRNAITSSPVRIARHVLGKSGFPIVTPSHTYSKVPRKASDLGLTVRFVPLTPESGFKLDLDALERHLQKQDSFVYVANPNNPTGNVLVTREQLEPLLVRYPGSRFWIDEAYVHYVDPAEHQYFSGLVPKHSNLMVSRTMSFAYGMAGLRIGYLLCAPELVKTFEAQLTDYRLGSLQEAVAIAALRDTEHLPFVRAETRRWSGFLRRELDRQPGVQAFPTQANFVFARFTNGKPASSLVKALAERGILIKAFNPIADQRYEEYFRITVGLGDENRRVMTAISEILGGPAPSTEEPAA
jgi:histidinol-phosphate aminotransferase